MNKSWAERYAAVVAKYGIRDGLETTTIEQQAVMLARAEHEDGHGRPRVGLNAEGQARIDELRRHPAYAEAGGVHAPGAGVTPKPG